MLWSIFSHAYLPSACCFGEVSVKDFGSFIIVLVYFLIVELKKMFFAFLSFGLQSFIRNVFCKYFLPICDLSSHSLDSLFHRADIFNFNEAQLINFFFHRSYLVSQKSLPNLKSQVLSRSFIGLPFKF